MKKFLSIALILLAVFTFASCNNVNNSNTDNAERIIDLTVDNYESFLTFEFTPNLREHDVSGVLRFAYYENVVLTYHVEYKRKTESAWNTTTFTVPLNAAGDASFAEKDIGGELEKLSVLNANDWEVNMTIENVSGRVIIH